MKILKQIQSQYRAVPMNFFLRDPIPISYWYEFLKRDPIPISCWYEILKRDPILISYWYEKF
jgi:hypothetical protein